MASERVYVLVSVLRDKRGNDIHYRRIARRESRGELIPIKRELQYEMEILGTWGNTSDVEIWEEECAFGEGHYVEVG